MGKKLDGVAPLSAVTERRRVSRARPRAKTALVRDLLRIRSRIVASGEPLLDWDELEKEVAERRGERGHER